ncbi:MAG: aldehyde dehydrogenase family protein, partial [Firmicutes bacterium]|nr:aldehyde dehydrogenase family protein [Bacillota bacterium]
MEVINKSKLASRSIREWQQLDGSIRTKVIQAMADKLEENTAKILAANQLDTELAVTNGISKALLDRLTLTHERIAGMAQGLRDVSKLPDPIGQVITGVLLPNGLKIEKVRVPIGVIGMIYEARPNVTADAAGLCLKAGNAVILRGGSEAINSNCIIVQVL